MKTTKTDRAQVAQVIIAGSTFEGVMFPDGSYGITVSQAATLFGLNASSRQASKELQRIHHKEFNASKEYLQGESHAQGTVSLEWFEAAIIEAAIKGNVAAQGFARAAVGNTLQMYLDDAFGIERATKERITWLEVRMAGIVARTSATDALRDALLATGQTPQAFHYIRLTEDLNQAALGFTAAQYKRVHGLETRVNMRERLTKDQLRALEFAEELFVKLLPKSVDWQEALSKTIETVSE
jgi:hypothetical protein